ncbi:DUF4012 domain-containing protein [Candidatus Parcubacteria bacterium]|nr:DUF4012 domain-containing protein [Candidatus Parcubacteria bacterium]
MFKKSKSKHIDFISVFHEIENKVEKKISEISYIKKKRRRKNIFRFIKYFSVCTVVFFLLILVVFLLNYVNIKFIYESTLNGKANIESAVFSVKNKDYELAINQAKQANRHFDEVLQRIEIYNNKFLVQHLPFLQSQIDDFVYLADTAKILSNVVNCSANFGNKLNSTINNPEKSFSLLTKDEKKKVLEFIYNNSQQIEGIRDETELALNNFRKIKYVGALLFFRNKISCFEDYLIEAHEFLTKAIPLSKILPEILGYPEKSSFLLILQNNDELRPTGGFIGTYGILEVENSDILRLDIHDVYHMDMPVKDLFYEMPPEPIKTYLKTDQWFMRDANWSPNWPTSAKRIEWFYENENALLPEKDQINKFNDKFDGVIGITPDFISSLLSVVGPITIDNEKYNEDNFHDLLQYQVEKGYIQEGVSSWHRKEVIGDIVKELKIKLFNLGPHGIYKVAKVVNEHLDKKDILFYVQDENLQELISAENWSGEVKEVDSSSDYFMVVDANMGSYKTDRVIDRNINYKVNQEIDGLYADLKINYAHGGDFDWKTTTYRTYTRVYVPKGSELIRAGGFNNSEKIRVYDELEKTVFAVFLTVEPGDIGGLYFHYKLPRTISDNLEANQYELLVQKQPGNNIKLLTVGFNFLDPISEFTPTGFYVYRSNKNIIKWEVDLLTDKKFMIKF